MSIIDSKLTEDAPARRGRKGVDVYIARNFVAKMEEFALANGELSLRG